MARSPVSPEGPRSGTRHVSFEEEGLRAKLLRLTVEEPEIMRDIVSAEAKWRKELRGEERLRDSQSRKHPQQHYIAE